LLVSLGARPAHSERQWHETTTSGVRIVSAVNAAQTEKIAADVELYFEAAKRIVKRSKIRPLVPVNMLVLDRRLWKYVDPLGRFDGRFESHPASAEIIVDASAWRSNSIIVFHELTHLVLRQSEPARGLPPFYNEGLADLLSTIEIKDGRLQFGTVPADRWQSLQLPRMPLEKVLNLGSVGDLHGREDVAAFYAKSWLIVHHAVFESSSRNEQLRRYRQLLVAGLEAHAAFDSVFGSEANEYEKELSQYARRTRLAYFSLPIDSLSVQTPEVRKLAAADGLNALGRWLVYARQVEDPQLKLLGELAKDAPPESVAALQLANALIQRSQLSTAKPLVEAGCVAPTVTRIALLCGDAYWEQLSAQKDKPNASSPDPSLAGTARKFYEAALRQEPDNLEALLSAAATFEAAPADSAAVRTGLESALQRNPNNSWVSARLSRLYRPLDLLKARDYMERAVLTAPDEEQEKLYAQELNRIGSELAAQQ
jgi:hypothetical protein